MSQIHTYRWTPPEHVPVRSTSVYLLHGTGEHAGRYEPLAAELANAGYEVGAHDHPGHGRSSGKRGVIDPPGALATTAAIQIMQFARQTNTVPVVFGHSLGGVVATELVLDFALPVSGLILSAPAFAPLVSKRDWLLVKALALAAPVYTVNRPYNASHLTHDADIQKVAEADPLNHGYKSASLVDWLMISGNRQLINAAKLSVDTLLLIAGKDVVVDSAKTQGFAKEAPAQSTVSITYEGYKHEILNESPEQAAKVRGDILSWLNERFAVKN